MPKSTCFCLRLFRVLAFALAYSSAYALSLADLTKKDADGGLRDALSQAATQAVATLGRAGGYLENPKVKIGLPAEWQRPADLLRKLGQQRYVDELNVAMNRAAEAAATEAKPLLVGAVKNMSLSDAKAILGGDDGAATEYFRRATSAPLTDKFKPIVRKSMAKVRLAEKYEQFADQAARFGLAKENQLRLDDYVTERALDGLYKVIGETEREIRNNPQAATTRLAKKVFGALR